MSGAGGCAGTRGAVVVGPARTLTWGLGTVAAIAAGALGFAPAGAQTSFQATLSADTVELGEVFELRVRVPVPAGSAVYFPDTVATTTVIESHAPVRWEAEPSEASGATLTLTYPVMAFGTGIVPVPGFDVFVTPAAGARAVAPLPGGSLVAPWSDAPTRGSAFARPLRVPRRGVWVTPIFTPEILEGDVQPMPSGDVVGASWHWPSVALVLLLGGAVVAVVVRALRVSREPSAQSPAGTPEGARRHALVELDLLLAEGLDREGRMQELYTRSSGIVRRYVERLDPRLGPDLTGSELVAHIASRTNGEAPSSHRADGEGHASGAGSAAFFREMRVAEVVKFGRLRPPRENAEAHVRSLRTWVDASGSVPW